MDLYHDAASTMPRSLRTLVALLVALFIVLLATIAWASKRSMIPPGREAEVRELVDRALAGDRPANSPPSFAIERDRIRVMLAAEGPRFVIFHPEVEPYGELGDPLASGVVVECGPAAQPRPCDEGERTRWQASAAALARERDPVASAIWQIEESGVESRPVTFAGRAERAADYELDRAGVWLAMLGALLIVGLEARSERAARRLLAFEWIALAGLLVIFVACTLHFTSPWPLHEHNSFVARADCAIDERCLFDPAHAWAPTSLHAQGLVLSGFGLGQVGAWLTWLSRVGVGLSVIVVVLVWGLARRLVIALGHVEPARFAGLIAAGLLCVHPVHWRLAGAASFWPLALVGLLGAALAGLWASEQASHARALLGWLVAALGFALACGGNIVLLSLVPLALLAPLCWTRVQARAGMVRAGLVRAGLVRAGLVGLPSVGVFAVMVEGDLRYGLWRTSESVDVEAHGLAHAIEYFDLLLFDPRVSTLIWAPLLVLGAAWLIPWARARLTGAPELRPIRLLAPILYAWLVPHLGLSVAAGELIGLGYPVGFLNHHWELVVSALAVGLGAAWLLAWGLARVAPERRRRVAALACAATLGLALLLGPRAREGWALATGELVVERELAALQHHFAELPEHDRLIVAPHKLEPLADLPRVGDPIEVVFPIHAYAQAMRALGREPGMVDDLDALARTPIGPHERVLVYVGASLRSFQPHEIRAGVVPEGLERPPLLRLRDAWVLEPVVEFELATAQHEAVSMRLGADRVPVVTLGFYWLRPTTKARGWPASTSR